MSRTFGWVQNPNRLEKLKYITGVMLKGSYSNTEMLDSYTSDMEVGLKNLSERGNCICKSERLERLYYRAMDRSRRATNPQNYNEGGTYIEVPNNYRASQYDHTADDYIKKKLSDRMYHLTDGTLVQRDWYSSFLLYCYDYKTKEIDKNKCITEFEKYHSKEKALIEWIKANQIKILNSGIKIA